MMKKRTDYIDELNLFLSSSKSSILKISEVLGWNNGNEGKPKIIQDEIVVCPLDSGHRMPKKSLLAHIEKCQLHKNGYTDCSLIFPSVCKTGPDTVAIDEATLNTILQPSGSNLQAAEASLQKAVPQTSDRLMSDFTPEERLAVYDYAVKSTIHCSEETVKEINLANQDVQDSKPLTLEELAAAGRDAKRRRIRYKSKKVHTNRKSRTEVLRAVIQSQMEGYVDWIKQQAGESVDEESEQNSSKLDSSSNIVQEQTSSIREISHRWDQFDYFGINPHKRYKNVLKDEADKKLKEDGRQFPEKHKSRAKESYNIKYDVERKRDRSELYGGSYKKYKNDESSSRNRFEKYHSSRERDELKSKEHRPKKEDYRLETTTIKTEPHSTSTDDKYLIDFKTDSKVSKDIEYHSSSKYHSSKNYEYDPGHDKNGIEKRMRHSFSKNHSESERESHYKSRDQSYKSHENKNNKHRSRKKKRKRRSSTESSEAESKRTDENDSY